MGSNAADGEIVGFHFESREALAMFWNKLDEEWRSIRRDDERLCPFRRVAIFAFEDELLDDEALAEAEAGGDVSIAAGEHLLLIGNAAAHNGDACLCDVGPVCDGNDSVRTIAEKDKETVKVGA